jgi:hypothetical protein
MAQMERERKSLAYDAGRRRSMRVLLSIPITVSGQNASGEDFTEVTKTLVVNAHGALIALAAPVAAGQKALIVNKTTQKAIETSVVSVGNQQDGKSQVAIEFIAPSGKFWQIDFPDEDWVVPEN